MHDATRYRLGIDLGSVNVKLALTDARGKLLHKSCQAHQGRPLEILAAALELLLLEDHKEVSVAVTGGAHALLSEGPDVDGEVPTLPHVNDIIAAAEGVMHEAPQARTVIDLGGQLTKWILLADERADDASPTVVDFATNGLCAAGSGAFLEQQAGRLELSLDELGAAAGDARRGASIAGRCSVFAKSDMIHLQQKGTPVDEMAFGLCQALTRTFHSTVMNGRAATPPVALIGGGAQSPGLRRAFAEELKLDATQLIVPPAPTLVGALGAALASGARPMPLGALRQDVQRRLAAQGKTTRAAKEAPLAPLAPHMDPSHGEAAATDGEDSNQEAQIEAFLGLDVGSVSTNLVLLRLDKEGGPPEVLQGVYLPTRGRPVEALREGLKQLEAAVGPATRIVGVGATGSGRHLAARLVGADVVRNEITAQMVSAVAYLPEVDTIFEIGGQDSKFISVKKGMLADFEMNKICAAGTGSFLEEQAERLGISIIDEFSEVARGGGAPADLGTRCTVFMDSELVRAQERGEQVEDLCAGLAYSVARNYLEKLVAGRHLGRQIVFQGGTASNGAVVGAFRALLGRAVTVHPENRISGAIGAALLAAQELAHSPYRSAFAGFDACEKVALRSFECRRCDNRCQVNRVSVGERELHFGDVCERFSEGDSATVKEQADRPFPELFEARRRLFEAHLDASLPPEGEDTRPAIGLLRGSLNAEQLPLWAAFLRQLGYRPVLAPATSTTLLKAHPATVPAEVCLPIKAAGAQLAALVEQGGVEKIFVPSVVELPHGPGDREAYTCFYTQQLPDMLRARFGERVLAAQFSLKEGKLGLADAALTLADQLQRPAEEILVALAEGQRVQARFVEARRELGRQALSGDLQRAVVVLGKPYNAHDPCLNLNLAQILHRAGLPAIPWDMLPTEDVQLDPRWHSVPWHYSREQLRAAELMRLHPRLFPVLISSFGCGPDGFVVKHLEEMMGDVPRLILEFDEHRGEAGLVTRVEAFSDEIDAHLRHRPQRRVFTTPAVRSVPKGRRFFVPNFSQHAHVFAGMLRGEGYEAEVLPAVDEQTIREGEELCSGRECHPYAVIAGELARLVRERDIKADDVFFTVSGSAPCLIRQYGDSQRLVAERLGSKIEVWDGAGADMQRIFGTRGMAWVYEGLLAVDVLIAWAYRLRPYLDDAGLALRWLDEAALEVAAACERRERLSSLVERLTTALWLAPRHGAPGDRPVVGITGDFYTRTNPIGCANLFDRLEELGCEVWLSPGFASMVELSSEIGGPHFFRQGRLRLAFDEGLSWAITSSVRALFARRLRAEVRELALELAPGQLTELASPYLGPRTNYLVTQSVAKIADFLRRGASGALNVAGLNCMVGTTAEAIVPALRKAHEEAPVLTLLYGGSEGPAQRIRLETFVHQVHQRAEARRAKHHIRAS